MSEKTPLEGERLQKVLAGKGLGSRREMETWIRAGRVRLNGEPAKLGDRVKPGDRVQVDGTELHLNPNREQPKRVIAYNKPEGEIVTRRDPEGRTTVFSKLPSIRDGRWINVGRLDINTSGLMLFTNDGELANRLMHPSREVEREYSVRILGEVPDASLRRLTEGMELEDGPARFDSVEAAGGSGANRWYRVVIREGRNREVRRLWEAVGATVSRLIRVRYGNVEMGPRLFAGHARKLDEQEIDGLFALAGLEPPRKSSIQKYSKAKHQDKKPWGRPTNRRGSKPEKRISRPPKRGSKRREGR